MKSLDDLARRLRLMARKVSLRQVDDAGDLQATQAEAMSDEVMEDVEVFRLYGLASNPQDQAEGILLALGGSQTHGVIIATDDRRYRLKVARGEVSLYDDLGQKVHLKRGGIEITSSLPIKLLSETSIDIEAPQINLTGDVLVDGDLLVEGDASVTGKLDVDGDFKVDGQWTLGTGAVLAPKLSDNSNATTGKAK